MKTPIINIRLERMENGQIKLHWQSSEDTSLVFNRDDYGYETFSQVLMPFEDAHRRVMEDLAALKDWQDTPPQPNVVLQRGGNGHRFRTPIAGETNGAGEGLGGVLGEYTDIEKRILTATGHKAMAEGNRRMLLEDRVFIVERGAQQTHASPNKLYEDPLFREYVDVCIRWQQQYAQNSSSRVSVAAIVKTVCNYIRPKSGWLDWRTTRLRSNDPVPVDASQPERIEVVRPRGAQES